jgi:hypothetical protein
MCGRRPETTHASAFSVMQSLILWLLISLSLVAVVYTNMKSCHFAHLKENDKLTTWITSYWPPDTASKPSAVPNSSTLPVLAQAQTSQTRRARSLARSIRLVVPSPLSVVGSYGRSIFSLFLRIVAVYSRMLQINNGLALLHVRARAVTFFWVFWPNGSSRAGSSRGAKTEAWVAPWFRHDGIRSAADALHRGIRPPSPGWTDATRRQLQQWHNGACMHPQVGSSFFQQHISRARNKLCVLACNMYKRPMQH